MSLFPIADRYLRSRLWWRRARALRALGLIQATDHTPQLVAALDDPHPDVRAAALDGLTDMHDLTALKAIVVRVHDTSLHRGRRGAALKVVRIRVRAVSAGVVGARSGQPAQLHPRPGHLSARPGRGPSCAVGLATPVSRCARRPLKRWHTWGSTTSRHASPSRGWRATIRRSGRWRPTRCGAGRALATRPLASRRISTTRGRSRSGPRERFSRWGLPAPPSCRPGSRVRTSAACSRARCCGSPALTAHDVPAQRAHRLLAPDHRLLRAVERLADRDEPPGDSHAVAASTADYPARPRPRRRRRGAAIRLDRRACVQRGTHDRRERSRLAGRRLPAARDRDRQRRVHGRHAGADAGDLSARAGTDGVRSAAALRAGTRRLPVGQRARSRGHRQAQRRQQGRRGQRRHQRRVRRPRARHRCRYHSRSRRARSRRAAVPRRPGDGGGRRQCRHRERLSHRARSRHRRRPATQLARAVPDHRVHARVPPVPARLRIAKCRRPDLGCIRVVPPRCRDRRRRLRPDRDRRGHRSHDPPAAALPRARRADPDRVRPQPPLLDAGA